MTFFSSNADDFPVHSFWGYQVSLLPPLSKSLLGGAQVSSSYCRSILSRNKTRATRQYTKSQRYGLHSLSLKSALNCITNSKYRKWFQNVKTFWYQVLNILSPRTEANGDMMGRALVCSLSAHSSTTKTLISKYHFSLKIKYALIPFFLTGSIKVSVGNRKYLVVF